VRSGVCVSSIAPSSPWVRGTHRGDQVVAHARDEEATEAARAVRDPERRIAGAGELAGAVDESLEDLLDREL
jgi:hypothetical protein